jgi:hypothetical protein
MTTLVYGEDDHQDVQSTTEEERAEVTKNIRAWYEEGVRFFTKDRLRSIHEQLQGLNGKAGKILIPDLNGGHTEKPVDLGRAIPIKDEDCVRVLYVEPRSPIASCCADTAHQHEAVYSLHQHP